MGSRECGSSWRRSLAIAPRYARTGSARRARPCWRPHSRPCRKKPPPAARRATPRRRASGSKSRAAESDILASEVLSRKQEARVTLEAALEQATSAAVAFIDQGLAAVREAATRSPGASAWEMAVGEARALSDCSFDAMAKAVVEPLGIAVSIDDLTKRFQQASVSDAIRLRALGSRPYRRAAAVNLTERRLAELRAALATEPPAGYEDDLESVAKLRRELATIQSQYADLGAEPIALRPVEATKGTGAMVGLAARRGGRHRDLLREPRGDRGEGGQGGEARGLRREGQARGPGRQDGAGVRLGRRSGKHVPPTTRWAPNLARSTCSTT